MSTSFAARGVNEPRIVDVAALLGPRTTLYRRADVPRADLWLDTPGVAHRDHQPVDPDLGLRIIAGLGRLTAGPRPPSP